MYFVTQRAHAVKATSEQRAADSAAKLDATITAIASTRTHARASVVSRAVCARSTVDATGTDSVGTTVRAYVMLDGAAGMMARVCGTVRRLTHSGALDLASQHVVTRDVHMGPVCMVYAAAGSDMRAWRAASHRHTTMGHQLGSMSAEDKYSWT